MTTAIVTTASKLTAIKGEVYRLMGISPTAKNPTKAVKEVYGYDFRYRDNWETVLCLETAKAICDSMDRAHLEVCRKVDNVKTAIDGLSASVAALDVATDVNYRSTFWGWYENVNREAGLTVKSVIVPGPRSAAENDD